MANQELQGNYYNLPKNVLDELKKKFDSYEKNNGDKSLEGYTRLKNLVETGKLTYENLKNIKHILEKNKENTVLYELNGGNVLETWINETLKVARTTSELKKDLKDKAGIENAYKKTHYKNSAANPTNPTKPATLSTSMKSVYSESKIKKIIVTEEQYRFIIKEDSGLKTLKGDTIETNSSEEDIDYANEKINEYNRNNSSKEGFPLYIGVTGKKQTYYTLWKISDKFDFYMKNLSIDLKKAVNETIRIAEIQNSKFIDFSEDFNSSRKPIDVIPFGKYEGKTLGEVFLENKGYIVWLVNNFNPKTKRDKDFYEAAKNILGEYIKDKTEKNKESDEKDFYPKEGAVETIIKITHVSEYIDEIYRKISLIIRGENDNYRFTFLIALDKIYNETNISNRKDVFKLIGREVKIKGTVKDRKEIGGLKYTTLTRVTTFNIVGGEVIKVLNDEEINTIFFNHIDKIKNDSFEAIVTDFYNNEKKELSNNNYNEIINDIKNQIIDNNIDYKKVLEDFNLKLKSIEDIVFKLETEEGNEKIIRDYQIYSDIKKYFFGIPLMFNQDKSNFSNDNFKTFINNISRFYDKNGVLKNEFEDTESKKDYLKTFGILK